MDADRKKKLINEYKDKLPVGAVYAYECSGNHRRWIKSTVNIEGIRNQFQFSMKMNGAPTPAQRREWVEYGAESFSLVILEELQMKKDQTSKEFADEIKLLRKMWEEKLESGDGQEGNENGKED